MITINGYKQFTYTEFLKTLRVQHERSGKKEMKIALDIDVKSPATILNAFNEEEQIVSDKVLTKIMKSIGLAGFIVWDNGKRFYLLPTSN